MTCEKDEDPCNLNPDQWEDMQQYLRYWIWYDVNAL